MENLMKTHNISSCQDYFCSGSSPIFNTTSPEHLRLISYCLYCYRSDWSEFQALIESNPQCKTFMDRKNTCPEGKCSDICIDNWTVYPRYNYFANGTYEISLCYIRGQNRFVYAEDYYHMQLWVLEDAVNYTKFAIHIVFVIALTISVIIPNIAEMISVYTQTSAKRNLLKIFGVRMLNIWALFCAQIPHIVFAFTKARGRYLVIVVALEWVILSLAFVKTAVLWLNVLESSEHKILWKNRYHCKFSNHFRILLFSLLGYLGVFYLAIAIVNFVRLADHIYLPLSGALYIVGILSIIVIATGLSIVGIRIYIMMGKAVQNTPRLFYKLKVSFIIQ